MMTLSMGLFSDKSFRKNIPGYRNENRTENVKAMAKTMAFIFCIRSHMRKLVNKIVDNLYLDRYSKQCFFALILDKAEPFHRALTVPVFPQHLLPAHNTDTEDGFWKDFGGLQKSGAGKSHSYRIVWRERLWKYTFFQTDDLIIQIHFYLQIVPDFVTETVLSLVNP